MNKNKLILLFYTVKYLKPIQVYFRLFYVLRRIYRKYTSFIYPLSKVSKAYLLTLDKSIPSLNIYTKKTFTFLHLSKTFEDKIDWNYMENGKLWTYNLTYFDYLNQKPMIKEQGIALICDFIEQSKYIKDGFEPFPVSLRGINWIKFLSEKEIINRQINDSLYAQYYILMDNIEYHLLGNHLLENGFSLLFGAYYFHDEKFYLKARNILTEELNEQILNDGAHFELSPMYHQIMLFRVLDCINLLQNNNWKEDELLAFLISKARVMLGWLSNITYEHGCIPLFNDSTNSIAPTTSDLNEYANRLKIEIKKLNLLESGYRKINKDRYEMILDVGAVGPDYIPGHAHSDTFNFELYIDGKPFIVDTGLSTYETNEWRTLERSTVSHNTVKIDGLEQSEVWGGFRVARRAKIIYLDETKNEIVATHDGYKRIGALHTRKFTTKPDNIMIEDSIKSTSMHECQAYLHFYPGIEPIINKSLIIVDNICIRIENATIIMENYSYASGFNNLQDAKMVILSFKNTLKVSIEL